MELARELEHTAAEIAVIPGRGEGSEFAHAAAAIGAAPITSPRSAAIGRSARPSPWLTSASTAAAHATLEVLALVDVAEHGRRALATLKGLALVNVEHRERQQRGA